MDVLLIAVVIFALLFDFTNGFHDTANAIATSVSTKAVSPKVAVVGAAVLNFLGAFVSLNVAATVAKGIVSPSAISLEVVLAGILGAIIWNLITWRFAMPTSSSHALIGGVAGSAAVAAGWHVINWGALQNKVLLPSLIVPVVSLIAAAILIFFILSAAKKYAGSQVNHVFKRLQLVSASFVAFTHGTNDAQKTMGIITLALLAGTDKEFHVPLWVILSSALAMALGTYIGGWRIINTLGHKIVRLEPPQGFAAETATASFLGLAAHYGLPVSTTHTISGAIMGAGVGSGREGIKWSVVKRIVIAWAFTIPCAAAIGAAAELLTRLPAGTVIASIVSMTVIALLLLTRNWSWETTAQYRAHLNLLRRLRHS